MQQPSAPSPAGADLDAAWLAEAGRCVSERLPGIVVVVLAALALAWIPEHLAHPHRDRAYALTLAAEALAAGAGLVVARRYRHRPAVALNAGTAVAVSMVACMAIYHGAVTGELELLAMASSWLLFGAATVLPWGARRQAVLAAVQSVLVVGAALFVPAIVTTNVAVFATLIAAAVAVYGAALAERQLRALLARDLALGRVNDDLSEASRLKSEFVAAVSHELRTPLNVIVGYVDMLLDGGFGPLGVRHRDPLVRVRRSAEELHALVTATLDLGRLEQGTVEVALAPVAVTDLFARLRRETREMQERSGLAFRWICDEDVPLLDTDAAKVDVVLKNLIANAVKFTDAGTVTVAARAHAGGVEISVHDTGIGIGPDTQAAIFDAFRQGPAAAARSVGGVGLGLHIVRRLLDLLGGSVTLESEEGRGSLFRVWLPCAAPSAQGVLPLRVAVRHEPPAADREGGALRDAGAPAAGSAGG